MAEKSKKPITSGAIIIIVFLALITLIAGIMSMNANTSTDKNIGGEAVRLKPIELPPEKQKCVNECGPMGVAACYGNTPSYRTCGNYDSDSCREWSGRTLCSANQTCMQENNTAWCEDNVSQQCTDTDNGEDYFIQGTVTSWGIYENNMVIDYCLNANLLREFYCYNDMIENDDDICPTNYGCQQGRCTSMIANLSVNSIPSQANLYVDNIYIGQTPMFLSGLNVSLHNITILKSGYFDYRTNMYLHSGNNNLNVALTPLNETGNLSVTSNPTNAEVYVDEAYIGHTPITVSGLSSRNHNVFVEKDGYYPASISIDIHTGEIYHLNVELTSNTTQMCADSDGGNNPYVRGTTTSWGPNGYSTGTDYCGNPIQLLEYYCGANNALVAYGNACPIGYNCLNGACALNQTGNNS